MSDTINTTAIITPIQVSKLEKLQTVEKDTVLVENKQADHQPAPMVQSLQTSVQNSQQMTLTQ